MHNGFVRVDEEKMSKSLGNFFTIREILKLFDAEVVRLFLVRSHYRSALNYTDAHMEDARQALSRLYTALRDAPAGEAGVDWNEAHAQRFKAAMDDDFNTSVAVAELFELANAVNRGETALAGQLKALGGVLGLLQREPAEFLKAGQGGGLAEEQVAKRIAERAAAKTQKNFAQADRIRDELLEQGIVLEDGPNGTTWRRA
jgi:cysteinyl-tRNA synthetase